MLLEVDGVTKKFGGLVALQNISFAVPEGETLGVMGANGAGKTTLFSLITGHAKPTSGHIRFSGQQITGKRPNQICALGIARTYQIVRPFRGLTVLENVLTGALYGSRSERSIERARSVSMDVLETVGLQNRSDELAGSLTLAGSKRLEVAKALSTGPRVILLDEVMAGLTPSEVNDAMDIIEVCRTKYGLTIVVIEHVMKALMRMCQRIVVLHHGEMIAIGTPQDVAVNDDVIRAYLGDEA